jgi:hypothetical protein
MARICFISRAIDWLAWNPQWSVWYDSWKHFRLPPPPLPPLLSKVDCMHLLPLDSFSSHLLDWTLFPFTAMKRRLGATAIQTSNKQKQKILLQMCRQHGFNNKSFEILEVSLCFAWGCSSMILYSWLDVVIEKTSFDYSLKHTFGNSDLVCATHMMTVVIVVVGWGMSYQPHN